MVSNRIVAHKQQMTDGQANRDFFSLAEGSPRRAGRMKILARVQRLEDGNARNVAPVGDGVSEMRIHFGLGYRVYYVNRGGELILLLCGGDKGSQQRDIEAAKNLAREED